MCASGPQVKGSWRVDKYLARGPVDGWRLRLFAGWRHKSPQARSSHTCCDRKRSQSPAAGASPPPPLTGGSGLGHRTARTSKKGSSGSARQAAPPPEHHNRYRTSNSGLGRSKKRSRRYRPRPCGRQAEGFCRHGFRADVLVRAVCPPRSSVAPAVSPRRRTSRWTRSAAAGEPPPSWRARGCLPQRSAMFVTQRRAPSSPWSWAAAW